MKTVGVSRELPSTVPVSLSFDDGLQFQYDVFLPILSDHAIKSTFFVITSAVNTLGFMSWEELTDLKSKGNEIGSHTHTHPHLPRLSKIELDAELKTSGEMLKRFGCKTLAYPFGEYDDNVLQTARQYYTAGRTYYDPATDGKDHGYNSVKCVSEEIYKLRSFPTENVFPTLSVPLLELSLPKFQDCVKEIIMNGAEMNAWTIFVFHGKLNLWNSRLRWMRLDNLRESKLSAKFRWLCEFLASNDHVRTLTIAEALEGSVS